MSDTSPGGGFQPRNTPAERRAFFDVQRQLTDIFQRLDKVEADAAVLEGRVDDLEGP